MLEMDFISMVQILTGPFASSTTNSEEPDPLLAGPFIASPIIVHIFKDHASFIILPLLVVLGLHIRV